MATCRIRSLGFFSKEIILQFFPHPSTHTSACFPTDEDIGRCLVETNAETFQFIGQDGQIDKRLEHVQDDEDEITGSSDGNDLTTTAFAVLGAFNDTWGLAKGNDQPQEGVTKRTG